MAAMKTKQSFVNGHAPKYRNQKVVIDGILFDSKKEANRWIHLKLLQDSGQITDLSRQVEFVLIPATPLKFPRKSEKGKRMYYTETKCSYYADFVYKDSAGNVVVEDTKGFRTPEYKIKRKLMLWRFGIQIKEV